MTIPNNLTHKPIILVNNYDDIDGKTAGATDAMALSLGEATYDKNEISAKIFRNHSGKWQRQSEELPLHRVLDLSILIIQAISKKQTSTKIKETICAGKSRQTIMDFYNKKENKNEIDNRIIELEEMINEFHK